MPTSSRPASNCGLTRTTTSAPGRSSGTSAGSTCLTEMNDTSIVTHVEGARVLGELFGCQRARVDPLEHDDAGIAPQLPVELAVADVERDDPRRAAPEQDVGEPAGRGADVERETSGHVDAEDVQRVRELDAAAADVRMVRLDQRHVGVRARPGCRPWRRPLPFDAHQSGEDQRRAPARARPRARARRAPYRAARCLASAASAPAFRSRFSFQLVGRRRPSGRSPAAGRQQAAPGLRARSSARSTHSAAIRRDASRP